MPRDPNRFWNPHLAGVALGTVLGVTFLVMGGGLGASGGSLRMGVAVLAAVARAADAATPPLARSAVAEHPQWLVYELFGVILGGLVASYTAGRLGLAVLKGPTTSTARRLALALAGGVLMGAAARISRGCASGQALTGGALLSVGSWVFFLSFFVGGYGMAWFVRRQWR
jgi:hypothetical protein